MPTAEGPGLRPGRGDGPPTAPGPHQPTLNTLTTVGRRAWCSTLVWNLSDGSLAACSFCWFMKLKKKKKKGSWCNLGGGVGGGLK